MTKKQTIDPDLGIEINGPGRQYFDNVMIDNLLDAIVEMSAVLWTFVAQFVAQFTRYSETVRDTLRRKYRYFSALIGCRGRKMVPQEGTEPRIISTSRKRTTKLRF